VMGGRYIAHPDDDRSAFMPAVSAQANDSAVNTNQLFPNFETDHGGKRGGEGLPASQLFALPLARTCLNLTRRSGVAYSEAFRFAASYCSSL